MSRSVVFLQEAAADVESIYAWYNRQQPSLGDQFQAELTECIQRLQWQPYIYPLVFVEFRRALLQRFPYEVIYAVENGGIEIAAVMHTAREPQSWTQRL